MATIYSLVCWGGSSGKSVTVSSTTDLVTLTNHGLYNATGVAFTSGTLPTVTGAVLVLNTTYYAKSTAANTFELYYDTGLTSKINFTSNGASLVMKSAYYLGLSSYSRWVGVYDGLVAWRAARNAVATEFDPEVCEIGMGFKELGVGTFLSALTKAPEITITSLVNGVRSTAFHGGVYGTGYTIALYALNLGSFSKVDGITIIANTPAQSGGLVNCTGSTLATLSNCILYGGDTAYCYGIQVGNSDSLLTVTNNLFLVLKEGIVNYGATHAKVSHNIVAKCGNGIYSFGNGTTFRYGYWYNNISVGNTLNYGAISTDLQGASGNFGAAGNSPWVKGAGTTGVISTTDFMDYANNDFRPALATSPQVDAGIVFYGVPAIDLAGDDRPNYNNGGAEAYDVGAYEFDHGFGPHPASHTLTLTNVVVGSRILIRDQADTTTHYSADAASSTVVVVVTVYGDSRDDWYIKVRKGSAAPFYQPYRTQMTASAGASSIYVSQIEDQ